MRIKWVEGFEIKTPVENGGIVISANREGMLSLANQLMALADGAPGEHIHYDENNSLEEGSVEMIIERTGWIWQNHEPWSREFQMFIGLKEDTVFRWNPPE